MVSGVIICRISVRPEGSPTIPVPPPMRTTGVWPYFCMYIMMMSAEVNVVFNAYFRKWWKRFKTSRNKKA